MLYSGYPKPATILHVKTNGIGAAMQAVAMTATDKVYGVLPLYHTSGLLGLFGSFLEG